MNCYQRGLKMQLENHQVSVISKKWCKLIQFHWKNQIYEHI